jgi:hypothetical protein
MKPSIPQVIQRFAAYRSQPGNREWGSLHIVLSDGNVGEDSVRFCMAWARDHNDTEGLALAAILLSMSRTQRLKLDRAVYDWLHRSAGDAQR